MDWIKARLVEGDTHAGFGLILQASKVLFPQYADLIDAATGLFAALAVVLKQKAAA